MAFFKGRYICNLLLLCILTSFQTVIAQTGVLEGKIIDKISGEELSGVTIEISETHKKVISDMDGNFSISNLYPGTYHIQVKMISYNSITLKEIIIKQDNSTSIKILLEALENSSSREEETLSLKHILAQNTSSDTI